MVEHSPLSAVLPEWRPAHARNKKYLVKHQRTGGKNADTIQAVYTTLSLLGKNFPHTNFKYYVPQSVGTPLKGLDVNSHPMIELAIPLGLKVITGQIPFVLSPDVLPQATK